MSVNLKVTLGTVNYVDFLHVVVAKVGSPATIAYQIWIDVPVTSYNFVIPNLDPDNYYIRYYDAATNVALGTLVAELIVNALTGDTIYERRFYTVDGGGLNDPLNTDTQILDPYLIGKNVTGVFKEGLRYLIPTVEYSFDAATGAVPILNGASFSSGEVLIVEIKYTAGTNNQSTSAVGLYLGNITITAAAETLLNTDANKRVRLISIADSQTITLPSLISIADGAGYYFDHCLGGLAPQIKIITNGPDRVLYNGLSIPNNLFTEFWVSKGEHLLLRKFYNPITTTSYWEVITDYEGKHTGEKVTVGYLEHVGIIPEDGRLLYAAQYPRLYWWVENVLPLTHKYSPISGVVNPTFVHEISRRGQFALDGTTAGIFRMPDTRNMSERALKDWTVPGNDTGRSVDYAGGYQEQMILDHDHDFLINENGTGNSSGAPYSRPAMTDNKNITLGRGKTDNLIDANNNVIGGSEQRVKNIGVIYGRRI